MRSPAGQVPRGVADYFWDEARQRRALEGRLLSLFRRWGYGDVIPPTFEYAETIGARGSQALQAEMCRFLDRDGSMLALRVDMTMAVARLVGTRLHDCPMPQRFCYAGSVFRDVEPRAGQQREFRQTGVELIGSGAPDADAEVLALTAKVLAAIDLENFRIVVGQMRYFDGLLAALQLSPADEQRLHQAIDRNSEAELDAFLRENRLLRRQQRAVAELPQLSGQDLTAILARAESLCLNTAMRQAVQNLRDICHALEAHRVLDRLALDLTEIHNLGYYTGITFEVLAPGVGFRLASGGRYDNLVGTFGRAQPAVGVAFGVERLLLAQQAHADRRQPPTPLAPDLLVTTGNNPVCMELVECGRAMGLHIALDLEQRRGAALWAAAGAMGIAHAFEWQDGGGLLGRLGDEGCEPAIQRISADAVCSQLAALAEVRRAKEASHGA